MLAHQAGQHDAAIAFITSAIARNPGAPHLHNNLGTAQRARGDLDAAIASYRAALQLNSGYAEAHNNLGNALREQGDLAGALASCQEALCLQPDYAEAHNNLGTVWQDQGDLPAAIAEYHAALRHKPAYAEARYNLGTALWRSGDAEAAIGQYREALRLNPGYAQAHYSLGNLLRAAGDLAQATECYRAAVQGQAEFMAAWHNLATALREQGDLARALSCYHEVARLRPDSAEAHNNLGVALQEQGDLAAAISCYQAALRCDSTYAEAHCNLGTALSEQGDLPAASAHHREALRLKPGYAMAHDHLTHQSQLMCEWAHLNELWREARSLMRNRTTATITPFTALTLPASAAEHLECAQGWAAQHLAPMARVRAGLGFHFTPASKPRLRLGYLSSDFHKHATSYLIAELFELHNRERFEVIGYSLGPDDGSAIRRRIVQACTGFVDLAPLSDIEAARRVHDDGVDIVIDLKGYTKGGRPRIFALRPAPVQISYLGFPGSMGADCIDYIITDRFITPPEQQCYFSERFVYLPDTYQVNDRQRRIAEQTPSRAECRLPETGFVYCCFNHSYKITPAIFDIWMRLLQQTPDSVLWLLEANQWAVKNLRREAHARGVAPERLVFAPRCDLPEHLARQRVADLFLDTLPVNAHTTASDALWAGLPVLTCAGDTFVSRVAGSLLHAIGLPELITTSLDDYERLALRLTRRTDELAALRARLAADRDTMPLFDTVRYTGHLETAYEQMWSNAALAVA